MRKNIVFEKSTEFAVRIYNLSKYLRKNKKEFVLANQILKSGTSIGANVCEANTAQSKKDFISKISISLKEAEETNYWLLLLNKTELISDIEYQSLNNNCLELIKMLSKIRSTAKQNINAISH